MAVEKSLRVSTKTVHSVLHVASTRGSGSNRMYAYKIKDDVRDTTTIIRRNFADVISVG